MAESFYLGPSDEVLCSEGFVLDPWKMVCTDCQSSCVLEDTPMARNLFQPAACPKCGKKFLFCTVCCHWKWADNRNGRFVNNGHLKVQTLTKHTETKIHKKASDEIRGSIATRRNRHHAVMKRKQTAQTQLDHTLRVYFSESSDKYLHYELLNEDPGFHRSVMVSNFPEEFGTGMEKLSETCDFQEDEVTEDFQAASNYWKLSIGMRKRITEQTHKAYMRGRRHEKLCAMGSEGRRIMPPVNVAEANRRYFRKNNTSIADTMPVPVVHSHHGHASVNLNECLKILLASGVRLEAINMSWTFRENDCYEWITETPERGPCCGRQGNT